GAAPVLNGNVHVFREKGDLIAGDFAPVALGLRQLDARADVSGGALHAQLAVDGSRIGTARVDATAQMIRGRLDNDSPLRLATSCSCSASRSRATAAAPPSTAMCALPAARPPCS